MKPTIEIPYNGNVFGCNSNIPQVRYATLRDDPDTEELSDEQVVEYAASHYGFDPAKVKPLRKLPLHMWLSDSTYKDSGGTIRRLPLYNASDWNYMCFEVCGRVWEVVDGDLCRVYE